MVDIFVSKGLDIPLEGRAKGNLKSFDNEELKTTTELEFLSLNLRPFESTRFKLNKKVGDKVLAGEGIAEDKSCKGRLFVAPASGTIVELKRGLKRRLLDVVIKLDSQEHYHQFPSFNLSQASKEQVIEHMKASGLFSRIKARPFDLLADPDKAPKSIFIKAIESAPFTTPQEMQVKGMEKEFQLGVDVLSKLTEGSVHLVHKKNCSLDAFTKVQNAKCHSFSGPHPCANPSLHIYHIDPIKNYKETVWTLDAYDVLCIGHLFLHNKILTDKIIALCGPGIIEEKRGFYKARQGYPIHRLCAGKLSGKMRYISGDVLTGEQVSSEDYLSFFDSSFSVIPENTERELLHFFRPGFGKFSATKTYISGYLKNLRKTYPFSTNQHGEQRAFIDANVYDSVMPMRVPTVPLIKAIMAEDFDLAEELGLLEIASEDFALPTFICPSKIEMCEIVDQGLKKYAQEVLS
ncbi:Na(+)-translocating NADH-quinone reductase subunit A [Chlamydiales bacterium SCGC AB-751-O23]|jgi:Na+-transporting NADH:ubiquinone oxidoreductase subunit A|nr:Na(+)-translocating NADH-quinone reductase subunit A [Chlamydiales bacterium SCGC AB-751-O23]